MFLLTGAAVFVLLAMFHPHGTLQGQYISCQQPFVNITDEAVLELSLKLSPDPYIPPREAWLKPEAGT